MLDIDPRHGGDRWEQEHARRLPQTRVHVTRSGGRHYLLRSRDGVRNSASKLAPGVDIRAGGGYIIWWPHAGLPVPVRGPIAHWPEWVLAILFPPPAPPPEPVLRGSKTVAVRGHSGAVSGSGAASRRDCPSGRTASTTAQCSTLHRRRAGAVGDQCGDRRAGAIRCSSARGWRCRGRGQRSRHDHLGAGAGCVSMAVRIRVNPAAVGFRAVSNWARPGVLG